MNQAESNPEGEASFQMDGKQEQSPDVIALPIDNPPTDAPTATETQGMATHANEDGQGKAGEEALLRDLSEMPQISEPAAEAGLASTGKSGQDAQSETLSGASHKDGGPIPSNKSKAKRKWNWKKKTLVVALSLLFVICSVGAGVFIYFKQIMDDPFSHLKPNTGTPLPSGSSYDDLLRQADQNFLNQQGIVNILLVGVDYAEERENWDGKHAYHADVMMVLAVNKTTQKVDMISLPRDTYAKIPDIRGIYKLNSSVDCGGGYPEGGRSRRMDAWRHSDRLLLRRHHACRQGSGGCDWRRDVRFGC